MKKYVTYIFLFFIPLQLQASLSGVESKINKLESMLTIKDRKARELQAEVFTLSREEKTISSEKEILDKKILRIKSSIRQYARFLNRLKKDLSLQRKLLQRRLRVLSKWKKNSLVDFLVSSDSIFNLDHKLRIVMKLAQSDIHLLKNYKSNRVKFAKNKEQLRRKLRQLSKLKSKANTKVKQLAKVKRKLNRKIVRLKKQNIRNLTKLTKIKKQHLASAHLNYKMGSNSELFERSFIELKGDLLMPLNSSIVRSFGLYSFKNTKLKLFRKGVLFKANRNDRVLNVAKGKVKYVGHLLGYGNVVIVDQFHNYYTIYANLANISVEVGEKLHKGQMIASVSKASNTFDRHLYFEIRHFSDPMNPSVWFGNSIKVSKDLHINNAARKRL